MKWHDALVMLNLSTLVGTWETVRGGGVDFDHVIETHWSSTAPSPLSCLLPPSFPAKHPHAAYPTDILNGSKSSIMALSLFRFARFLRSIFVPTASIIAFSCLLTFIFVLYQPTPGPGSIQKLGWQSWDIVTDGLVGQSPASALETTTPDNDGTVGTVPVGVDWWNVSTGAETIDTASLPLDVWDPLMQHDTGREFLPQFNIDTRECGYGGEGEGSDRVCL